MTICLGVVATPIVVCAQHTLGAEFQVNTYTPLGQVFPAVAAETDGDFVVVWHRPGTGSPDIFLRRFTSAGVALAADARLNVFTTGAQSFATVDVAADGRFVVAWASDGQDGYESGVFGRRLDASGMPLAVEFQVNTITTRSEYDPALAVDADGDFVVVWSRYDATTYLTSVFGQRFDSAGTKLGSEILLNTNSNDFDFVPAIGMDGSGGFVVAWSSYRGEASLFDVVAKRFTSAGALIGGEFVVNTNTPEYQGHPDVAVSTDGRFVVAWSSEDQDGSQSGIFAQRFSSSGVKAGAEFRVNTYTPNDQDYPAVEIDGDGDFVVTWASDGQDDPIAPTLTGVFGRRFTSSGSALATEFQVNSYTGNHQRQPASGIDADGDFVVAWESTGQDGANEGIFAQRFSSSVATSTPSPTVGGPTGTATATPTPTISPTGSPSATPTVTVTPGGGIPLDADGNGALAPLTDGLLILRRLFGFTGPILVTGAVAGNCTRCDGPAVQSYLSGLGLVLDIDGNSSLEPLTDGLLVLRYLFGFTGATLVNGAIGANCMRCDAPAVTTYLQSID
jgi:hypothetical protein